MWTVDQWADAFACHSSEAKAYVAGKDPADSYWMYYTIGQRSEGFISMYQATGDTGYLTPVLEWVESVIAAAQPCDTLEGGYTESDRLGWISLWPAHAGREISLNEAYAWRFVARLLWVSRGETDPSFRARWEAIRDFTDAHIWTKWYNRGVANLYRSRTHMASHWAIIGMYVAALSDDPALRAQGDEVARNIMYAGMPADSVYPGDSILNQLRMRVNPASAEAAWFNDVWGSSDLPGSDVSHGEAVATASYFAWEQQYPGFDDALMLSFARLFRPVTWRPDDSDAYYADGTGTPPSGVLQTAGGYARFGHFAQDLQAELHLNPKVEDCAPGNRGAWFIGNAAQSMRVWQQKGSPLDITLTTDKSEYLVGEAIEATVTVDGAEAGGSREVQIVASVVVDGTTYSVDAPVTVTWPASTIEVESVTAEGIAFEQTADPFVWTGVAA